MKSKTQTRPSKAAGKMIIEYARQAEHAALFLYLKRKASEEEAAHKTATIVVLGWDHSIETQLWHSGFHQALEWLDEVIETWSERPIAFDGFKDAFEIAKGLVEGEARRKALEAGGSSHRLAALEGYKGLIALLCEAVPEAGDRPSCEGSSSLRIKVEAEDAKLN